MKLKTLNAHPSLFFDLRALVEKAANCAPQVVSIANGTEENYAVIAKIESEARAILEKFKKLEEK